MLTVFYKVSERKFNRNKLMISHVLDLPSLQEVSFGSDSFEECNKVAFISKK